MKSIQTIVISEIGLHARPASLLVKCANQFQSRIEIRKTHNSGSIVNAKSILHVLTLGVNKGDEIELIIEGDDEERAAETLKRLIDADFSDVDNPLR